MKLNYLTPQILCAIFAIASFATPGKAADKVYDKACAEYTKGDYKAAKDDFLSASKQNPKNWQALYQLANCYVQLKDFTNAKKSYADCLTLGPSQDIQQYCEKAIVSLSSGTATVQTKTDKKDAATISTTSKTSGNAHDADNKSEAVNPIIEQQRAKILTDAQQQADRIRAEATRQLEEAKANSNQRYKYPDGSTGLDVDPEITARINGEAEERARKIMEDATRRASALR